MVNNIFINPLLWRVNKAKPKEQPEAISIIVLNFVK